MTTTILDFIDDEDVREKLRRLPVVPHRFDGTSPFGYPGVQSPLSIIDGETIPTHEVALGILIYHQPPPARVLDPTCGKVNRQFGPWLRSGVLEEIGYEYIAADLMPYGELRLDVHRLPVRDGSVDAVVYDPPYTPHAREGTRGEEYGVSRERTLMEVCAYHAPGVYAEFHRVLRKRGVLIVKGTDVYYPRNTDNLYPFLEIVGAYREFFRPVALYVYRFYHHGVPLYRYRMRNIRRPVTVHSYYLVLRPRRLSR